MRLLEKARSAPTLSDIGLSFQMQMDIEKLNHTSLGAFLVKRGEELDAAAEPA